MCVCCSSQLKRRSKTLTTATSVCVCCSSQLKRRGKALTKATCVCVLQGLGEQGGPVVQRPHAAGQDLPARARPPQTDPSTAPRPPPPHARRRGGLTARSVTGLLQARRRHSDGQVTAIVSSVQDFTAAGHQLQVTLPLTGVDLKWLNPILPKLLSLCCSPQWGTAD